MKKRILYIILLLVSLPTFAQVGPSWRPPERTKKWFTDSIYVAKDARFNSTLRINENALRIGGVTIGTNGAELNILDGALVNTTELNRLVGVTSGVQTQLNSKAPLNSPAFTGTVTIPTPFTLGATSVTTTGTDLNYVSGVTSNIQTQLNARGRVYSDTMSVSAGVLRTKVTTITTEPYSVQIFSSTGKDITHAVSDSISLDGGVYKLYVYSVDALSGAKIKILY